MHMLVDMLLSGSLVERNLVQYQVLVDYDIVHLEASGIEATLLQAHLQNAMLQIIFGLLLVTQSIILKMLVRHEQMQA